MPDDLPTYVWGDTIRLRLEVEHETNLNDVWAIFRKQGETFEFWLKLQNSYDLSLIEWHGEKRISQVLLEAEVDRANQLPGDYELMAVRGEERSPVGGSARPGRDYLEFDFPDNVRLRIAEPPPATRPKVASYEFQPPS